MALTFLYLISCILNKHNWDKNRLEDIIRTNRRPILIMASLLNYLLLKFLLKDLPSAHIHLDKSSFPQWLHSTNEIIKAFPNIL